MPFDITGSEIESIIYEEILKIPSRVDRGVAWLDNTAPNWRNLVDPNTLRLSSGLDCIQGQLFGCYEYAPLNEGMSVMFGFQAPTAVFIDGGLRRYFDELTNEWLSRL